MAVNFKQIENDSEFDRLLNRDFVNPGRTGFLEIGEDKFCLPVYYRDYEERLRKFEVRDDDIFVATHPKAGTTWALEMVWLIVNNFDYEGAKRYIQERCRQLELATIFDFKLIASDELYSGDPLTKVEEMESPRTIKTHLHWSLLPEQIRNGTKLPKIISVLRNPQDVCVSFYHHCRLIQGYKGTYEDFCELFLAGRVIYGPYWKQVVSYWEQRERPNLLFIKYTDMKSDLPAVIRNVAQFLGKTVTDVQMKKLVDHLSFESMKNNPAVNFKNVMEKVKKHGISNVNVEFMRSGIVGSHTAVMTPELIKRFEETTKENFTKLGLTVD